MPNTSPRSRIIEVASKTTGPGDLLYRAVEQPGIPDIRVHGLTLKPRKPAIGLVRNKPIFGLPGYPTSALMIFHVLVAPVVRRLSNTAEVRPVKVQAFSPMKSFKARGRRDLLPVQLTTQPNGQLSAYPMQSFLLSSSCLYISNNNDFRQLICLSWKFACTSECYSSSFPF